MTVQKQSAKQKAPANKKIGNNRDFLPMSLFCTPQIKLSKEKKKKYKTQQLSVEF